MRKTAYNVPAKGAPPLMIPATLLARGVEVVEDEALPTQGFVYGGASQGFVPSFTVLPDKEPLQLGNKVDNYKGEGQILGWPIQRSRDGVLLRAADTLIAITSATATATVVVVTEWE